METSTFSIVTAIAMGLTLTVAALSIIGISITGLYPGILVLCLLALVPVASKHCVKKLGSKPDGSQRNYLATLTVINLLAIVVVVWMTFVILVDRVFSKVL